MKATDALQKLLELGKLVRGAKIGQDGGPASVADWLNLVLNEDIDSYAKSLLADLTADDFSELLAATEAKRDAILAGADPTDPDVIMGLDPETQRNLLAIQSVITVLAARNEAVAMNKSPVQWLAANVLPLVQTAIPIVLTLI